MYDAEFGAKDVEAGLGRERSAGAGGGEGGEQRVLGVEMERGWGKVVVEAMETVGGSEEVVVEVEERREVKRERV